MNTWNMIHPAPDYNEWLAMAATRHNNSLIGPTSYKPHFFICYTIYLFWLRYYCNIFIKIMLIFRCFMPLDWLHGHPFTYKTITFTNNFHNTILTFKMLHYDIWSLKWGFSLSASSYSTIARQTLLDLIFMSIVLSCEYISLFNWCCK